MKTPLSQSVCSVKDVPADKFISAYAGHLKRNGKFRLPSWVDVAKTGRGRELAPYDEDWLFIRASAIIRHLYIRPDQGVGALRNVYGNKKRRGAAPGHHVKASGGLIRYCLQQLESLGLLEKTKTGGRRLTPKGQRDICIVAKQIQQTVV